ncbi:threonine synthase [Desulfopila sp. IMCC35006]|uniref:threonine synthase n=1 Tax=Desulfopila sp. IMCC35006 TaxID=2569542 RepID=UPI0010AD1E0C|nr:threonine synthase [Desulfopila sp. IMCC35006]TKB28632.1 threonine synthase [Desulfopila sp. IMCC35006]
MNYVSHATCMICGKTYLKDQFDYICPDHGTEGILDIQYDYDAIKKDFSKAALAASPDPSIFRYRPLLPVEHDALAPTMVVGNSPLLQFDILGKELGVHRLFIKDDGRLPTASFKDRASTIAVVKAQEQKAGVITTASTGNAAAALSGICASVGQKNVIFVPASAPRAKLAQLLMFGSIVILVDGTYDDAFELCLLAADEYGWYNRNTGYNPYMTEGKKTCAFEICEQLCWQAPDAIFVSVGDGCIIGGIHKGLKDLLALGWIDKMPRLYGVQAEGSSYMAQAWREGGDIVTKPPIAAQTVADSISAGLPRDRIKALHAVKDTNGAYLSVSDDDIIRAIPDLARKTGIFAEPAGAATWAGLQKAASEGLLHPSETVVMINTGSGLKDINSAMDAVGRVGLQSFKVEPTLENFKKIASQLNL